MSDVFSVHPPREIFVYDKNPAEQDHGELCATGSELADSQAATPAKANLTARTTDVTEPEHPKPPRGSENEPKRFTFDGISPVSSVVQGDSRDDSEILLARRSPIWILEEHLLETRENPVTEERIDEPEAGEERAPPLDPRIVSKVKFRKTRPVDPTKPKEAEKLIIKKKLETKQDKVHAVSSMAAKRPDESSRAKTTSDAKDSEEPIDGKTNPGTGHVDSTNKTENETMTDPAALRCSSSSFSEKMHDGDQQLNADLSADDGILLDDSPAPPRNPDEMSWDAVSRLAPGLKCYVCAMDLPQYDSASFTSWINNGCMPGDDDEQNGNGDRSTGFFAKKDLREIDMRPASLYKLLPTVPEEPDEDLEESANADGSKRVAVESSQESRDLWTWLASSAAGKALVALVTPKARNGDREADASTENVRWFLMAKDNDAEKEKSEEAADVPPQWLRLLKMIPEYIEFAKESSASTCSSMSPQADELPDSSPLGRLFFFRCSDVSLGEKEAAPDEIKTETSSDQQENVKPVNEAQEKDPAGADAKPKEKGVQRSAAIEASDNTPQYSFFALEWFAEAVGKSEARCSSPEVPFVSGPSFDVYLKSLSWPKFDLSSAMSFQGATATASHEPTEHPYDKYEVADAPSDEMENRSPTLTAKKRINEAIIDHARSAKDRTEEAPSKQPEEERTQQQRGSQEGKPSETSADARDGALEAESTTEATDKRESPALGSTTAPPVKQKEQRHSEDAQLTQVVSAPERTKTQDEEGKAATPTQVPLPAGALVTPPVESEEQNPSNDAKPTQVVPEPSRAQEAQVKPSAEAETPTQMVSEARDSSVSPPVKQEEQQHSQDAQPTRAVPEPEPSGAKEEEVKPSGEAAKPAQVVSEPKPPMSQKAEPHDDGEAQSVAVDEAVAPPAVAE